MVLLLGMFVILNLILAALTIPMITGSLRPNPWYGFRTPSTINDPQLWYPVNRCAGKWLLWSSLLNILVSSVLYLIPGISLDTYALSVMGFVILGLIITMQRSFKLLKELQRH